MDTGHVGATQGAAAAFCFEEGGTYTLEVHVKDGLGADAEAAKVVLWQAAYYLTTYTGSGGKARLEGLGTFTDGKLTATKHNYLPALEDDVVIEEE